MLAVKGGGSWVLGAVFFGSSFLVLIVVFVIGFYLFSLVIFLFMYSCMFLCLLLLLLSFFVLSVSKLLLFVMNPVFLIQAHVFFSNPHFS